MVWLATQHAVHPWATQLIFWGPKTPHVYKPVLLFWASISHDTAPMLSINQGDSGHLGIRFTHAQRGDVLQTSRVVVVCIK